jgi:hypothetical protein
MTLDGRIVAFGAALALSACGGSSTTGRIIGYTGKTTPAVITDANAGTLAASAASVGGVSVDVGYVAAVRAEPRPMFDRALGLLAGARRDAPVSVAGIVQSASQACPGGGTMAASVNDQDGDGATAQRGDWAQIVFSACRDAPPPDGTGELINGTLRLDITASDGKDPSADPTLLTSGFAYGMKMTLGHFSIEEPSGA